MLCMPRVPSRRVASPLRCALACAAQVRSLFFGDYMDAEAEEPSKRVYDEVTDIPKLIARMEEYLVDHNAMSKRPMNLAIFL